MKPGRRSAWHPARRLQNLQLDSVVIPGSIFYAFGNRLRSSHAMHPTPRRSSVALLRIVLASTLALLLAGCGSSEPTPVVPDYLEPEGREVIERSYEILKECQNINTLLALNEIIALSDPVGSLVSLTGESIGKDEVQIPANSTVDAAVNINRICCEQIHKEVSAHVADNFSTFSGRQRAFWQSVMSSLGGGRQCKPPGPGRPPGGRGFTGGREFSGGF